MITRQRRGQIFQKSSIRWSEPAAHQTPPRHGSLLHFSIPRECWRFIDRSPARFYAQTTWAFLRRLRQASHRADRQVLLVTDNAKYHHACLHAPWRAAQEPDFLVAFLPPYSPELNPIERVWKLVRRLCLRNRYFPDLALVSAAADERFAQWAHGSPVLVKLCAVA